jgi:hypothetical protein
MDFYLCHCRVDLALDPFVVGMALIGLICPGAFLIGWFIAVFLKRRQSANQL